MTERNADNDLVRRAKAGDTGAFATLCERHRARVWWTVTSVARGPDAEDLMQEAFVRAYCALYTFREEASFEAWLCRIALNAAHDYQRSAWKQRVLFWQNGPDQTHHPDPASPEAEVAHRETQQRVRKAVSRLPEPQRVPIWLHYFEGFTLVEIARLEGVPESTIRSRVHAGLRRLQRSLNDLMAFTAENPARLEADAKGCQP